MRAIFNGVDRKSGGYLFAPENLETIAVSLPSDPPSGRLQDDLERRHRAEEDDLGVMIGFEPEDLASVGWAVVTAPDIDPDVQAALEPLLTRRESAAGERFHRLTYQPDEDADSWLDRHGVAAPHLVDPRRGVPYYLLLVGDPATMPYSYQYELGLNYAVGRIHFDTAGDVNNAVHWAAVEDELAGLDWLPGRAELEYHRPILPGAEPELVTSREPGELRAWLRQGPQRLASAWLSAAGRP